MVSVAEHPGLARFAAGAGVGLTVHSSLSAVAWVWAANGGALHDDRLIPWVTINFASAMLAGLVAVLTLRAAVAWGVVAGSGVALLLELFILAVTLGS